MSDIIFGDLPALVDNNLKFRQYVSHTIIPYWNELRPDLPLSDIIENAIQNNISGSKSETEDIDPDTKSSVVNDKDFQKTISENSEKQHIETLNEDLKKYDKYKNQSIEETINDMNKPKEPERSADTSATKSPKEIMKMIGKKIDEPESEEQNSDAKETNEFKPNNNSMLTGELIQLCGTVSKRLSWYNDIGFGDIKSIVEKRNLKAEIVKFESRTIISFMNRFKKIFDLLSHHDYPINMLSSTETRTYLTVYDEFTKINDLMEQISLLDEMRMIPSSWLPKEDTYKRPKRVSPTVGKGKGSMDKSEQ